ncbi:MAG: WxcM-like domain-containing protein [Candidatus Aenigmarchaeota archaeon]|nr:WxcM-like domain-containing protein [Candidatus Aenigmarchaeota archaeon]
MKAKKISLEDGEKFNGHCGKVIRRVFEKMIVENVEVYNRGAKAHYHKKITEYYVCLRGKGLVVVWPSDDESKKEEYELNENDILEIPPNTFHKIVPIERNLMILVIRMPPISNDEFFK